MKHENGSTMIVVIGALLAVSLIGVAMLKLSTSDQLSNVYYSSSASARSSVASGVIATKQKIESQTNAIPMVSILNNWILQSRGKRSLTESDIWLFGSPTTYTSISGGQQFRTKILAFDDKNFNVSLYTEGLGKGDSKASSVTVFNVAGLMYKKELGNSPSNAIHLEGDDNFEMNCSLSVHGDVYFGGQLKMNNSGFIVDGNFRMANNTLSSQITHHSSVLKNSYWGGKLDLNASMDFYGKTAFDKTVQYSRIMYLRNTSYSNGELKNNGANARVVGTTLNYWQHNNMSINSNVTIVSKGKLVPYNDSVSLLSSVGFTDKEPSKVVFNYDLCNSHVYVEKTVGGNDLGLTATDFNTWYTEALNAGKLLNNEFLVVKVNQNSQQKIFAKPNNTQFSGKMILLIDGLSNANMCDMFETTNDANATIWIKKGSINGYPMDNFTNFRGLVYVNSGGLIVNTKNSDPKQAASFIKGSLYYKDGAAHKFENGGLLDITFDQNVIDQLSAAEVFVDPAASNNTEELVLSTSSTNLLLKLISQSM